MKDYSPGITPIVKSDKFSVNQFPSNDLKKGRDKEHALCFCSWELNICSGLYKPNIPYAIRMLGRYHNNSGLEH